ncbi:MAG: peptide ABC transporter substrate-binding protein [Spirochaetales bacterium]|nr:peptide ABC transporter substrate-binding protein [Spirochaetales bacterium]
MRIKNLIKKAAAILFLYSFFLPAAFADDGGNTGSILKVGYTNGRVQLDPAHSFTTTEAQLYTAIYEGLVGYHPLTLEPVPAAASRWIISPDGKTYSFFLRPEGRYWNGDHVTAAHFRDAWMRILNPEENAEYSFMFDIIEGARAFRSGETLDPADVGIRVISPLIIEIKLNEPADYFLKLLCHHSFSPVNPENLKNGHWKKGPSAVGNGPFYIMERTEQQLKLRRNVLYWDREHVRLSEIHLLFNDDAEEAASLLNSGEVHWAASGIYLSMVDNPENIVTNPLFGTTYFFFNTTGDAALKIPEVRRGLSLILPWENIRTTSNFFIPSSTLVPGIPGYPEIEGITKRDMRQALSLLHEAGYTKGRGLAPIVIMIPESRDSMFIASLMKQEWEKFLDIKVEIVTSDFDNYYNKLKEPGYSLGTTTWIGDYADPLTFLQMWTADSNLNDSGHDDLIYDKLLEEAIKEQPKERYRIMAEAEKRLLDGALVLPIENYPAFNAVNIAVLKGWYPNVLDIHPFKYLNLLVPKLPDGLAISDSPSAMTVFWPDKL